MSILAPNGRSVLPLTIPNTIRPAFPKILVCILRMPPLYRISVKSLEGEVHALQRVSGSEELRRAWMRVDDDDSPIVQRLCIAKRLHRFLSQNQKDDWLILYGKLGQKMLLCRSPQI